MHIAPLIHGCTRTLSSGVDSVNGVKTGNSNDDVSWRIPSVMNVFPVGKNIGEPGEPTYDVCGSDNERLNHE